jgi:anti-sigma regulatory factor (Ser/Thr protein kinase)
MFNQENISDNEIEIHIHAQPEFLCVVRSAVRKAAEITGLDEQEVDRITLAMEEALTNAIKHSYGGPCSKPIVIKVRKLDPQEKDCPGLEIIVRDYGKQVDPATIKSRNLNQIKPGGLGVHIIHSFMDETEYTCPTEGGMQVRMVKYHDPSKNVQTACSVDGGS